MQEQDLGNTQFFNVESELETGVKVVLYTVYEALVEKGYNPVNQIVGYIMSRISSCRKSTIFPDKIRLERFSSVFFATFTYSRLCPIW